MTKVSVSVSDEGEIAVLRLQGDVTALTDAEISGAAGAVLRDHGRRKIVMDFQGVEYINSAGFGTLIGVVDEARKVGGSVVMAGLTPHFRKMAGLIGLSNFTRFTDTIEEAKALLA